MVKFYITILFMCLFLLNTLFCNMLTRDEILKINKHGIKCKLPQDTLNIINEHGLKKGTRRGVRGGQSKLQ